jgi:hypothetical protein
MHLNSDFGARAAVHAARLDWTPSPTPGWTGECSTASAMR